MEEKKEKVLIALKASLGIITTACEAAGISNSTFNNWRKADPEFSGAVEAIESRQGDFVESKLLEKINAGDTTAIIFYLKTKGKNRGYVERYQMKEPPKPAAELPAPKNTGKRLTSLERKMKLSITKLLKGQGKYTEELSYQVEITAKLFAKAHLLEDEMKGEDYRSIKTEISREGNERLSINPKERLYMDLLAQGQKALRALGMNTESKERRSDNDTFTDFLQEMRRDDE